MGYFGVTTNIKKRWKPSLYKRHNGLFAKLIDKYGWENIEHKVLFRLKSKKIALKMEDLLICFFTKKGLCVNQRRSGLISSDDKNGYFRKWYQEQKDDPEFKRKKNERAREIYNQKKYDPEYKRKMAERDRRKYLKKKKQSQSDNLGIAS